MRQSIRCLLAFLCAAPQMAAAQASGTGPTENFAEIAGACGGEVSHDDFAKLPKARQHAKLSCYLGELSKRLNRKLPTRIEYTTIVERTNVVGEMIVYHFRADIDRSEVKPGEMEAWKPTVRAQICADPALGQIISLGGACRYVWRDHDGKYIDTLTVRDCSAQAS